MIPAVPEKELNDREQDTWELLFAIADRAGDDWALAARAAATELSFKSDRHEDTMGVRLLADLRGAWRPGEVAIPSSVILTRLRELEEAPWTDWRGKPLEPRGLAGLLRPFGIRSRTIKWNGSTPKGYRLESLTPVWDRDLDATDATDATDRKQQVNVIRNPSATVAPPDLAGDGPRERDPLDQPSQATFGSPAVAEVAAVRAFDFSEPHTVSSCPDPFGFCSHCQCGSVAIAFDSIGRPRCSLHDTPSTLNAAAP